jgi:hypothetical protein
MILFIAPSFDKNFFCLYVNETNGLRLQAGHNVFPGISFIENKD